MTPPADDIFFDIYKVLRRDDHSLWEIGRGTRDVTYKAVDTTLNRTVALRLLRDEYLSVAGARDQFVEDVRRTARFQHPHIATLLSLGPAGGACFCTMEFVSDETVESLVRRSGPLEPPNALLTVEQATRALREIWQQGLVVTDLQPSKLALMYTGDELVLKLSDLHLSAPTPRNPKPNIGTTADPFWSPEQAEDAGIDVRSNIYSLGLILRFMLSGDATGAAPLSRSTPQKVVQLLDGMLQRDPERRMPSPFELGKRIRQCVQGEDIAPVPAQPVVSSDRLAEHFTLKGQLEGGEGLYLEAEDRKRGGEVVVHVFGPDELSEEVDFALRIADFVIARPHENILRAIEAAGDVPRRYVAYERVHGFRLLDVLRRRRKIPLGEALSFLTQMAGALDHAVQARIPGLDFQLASVRLSFDASVPVSQFETLPAAAISQWPSFHLKIPLFGSYPQTHFPGPTDAGGDEPEARTLLQAAYLRSLAASAYELLGGTPQRPGANRRSLPPVAALSETGNRALRQVMTMDDLPPFPSATEFVAALRSSMSFHPVEPAPPVHSAAPPVFEESVPRVHPARTAPAHESAATWNTPRHPRRAADLKLVVAIIVAVILGAFFFFVAPTILDRNSDSLLRFFAPQLNELPPGSLPGSQPTR